VKVTSSILSTTRITLHDIRPTSHEIHNAKAHTYDYVLYWHGDVSTVAYIKQRDQ